MSELVWMTAVELADQMRRGEVSAVEVLTAHLEQIEAVNPALNAIVTYLPEMALDLARKADERKARGEELGLLHGLPIAHKDLFETKGIRTTSGSTVFADHVPEIDDLIIARLKDAGCITLGKTNVPEFGAGSHSFNPVFGATHNPYDHSKTCGGSSGGAAVALAAGMIPIADGSDMGGSLRNPASFCNVVGFRPSPGRVPRYPKANAWSTLAVDGPMGRTVQDVALMLSAIAGYDARSPIAIQQPGSLFERALERDFKGVRIAWSPDLGELPVDPKVVRTIEEQLPTFNDIWLRCRSRRARLRRRLRHFPDPARLELRAVVCRAYCRIRRSAFQGDDSLECGARQATERQRYQPRGSEAYGTFSSCARVHGYL